MVMKREAYRYKLRVYIEIRKRIDLNSSYIIFLSFPITISRLADLEAGSACVALSS